MPTLSFAAARECVQRLVREGRIPPPVEPVALPDAAGRVIAEDIRADRDTPALSRSVRDGFAIRAADVPGDLEVIGEVRAGQRFAGVVGPGQAVEIMTGAPVPPGADAVIMVEYVTREGSRIRYDRPADVQQFINRQGCEAARGETVLHAGTRLDYSAVSLLAAFGRPTVQVYRQIEVAILPTGDELVEVNEPLADHQVRNSNAWSLAAQVARAGAIPRILPVARDTLEDTQALIERGLGAGLLLLSGGVSAGKYDVVEQALAEHDATFHFDRVLIQPGQPVVFGSAGDRFFFGLPGNPASTMVTFETLARAAVELLSGDDAPALHMPFARLTREFRQRAGLTRFLPACLTADGGEVTPVQWSGSGDIPAMTRANCYLVSDPDRADYARGDWIRVLAK